MNLFNFAGFGKTQNQPSIVRRVSDYFSGFGSTSQAVAPALTNESALETASVLAAVKIIAQGVAITPIRLVEEYSENGLERTRILKGHWAHKLLNKKPNSWQTPTEFLEGMMVNAILGKGALAIKVTVGNEVRELIPVPAGSFTVETLSDTSVQYRVNYTDGSQQVFLQNQVLYIRGISLDGYTAVSMLEKARAAVGLAKSLENQQLQLAAKGGNPSGSLSFQGELSQERKSQLRDAWNAAYGAGGSGGIAVLDAGTQFNPISMSMADSQFIENRKFQIEEVARTFNISPLFLGHNAGINVDGVDAAMRFHVKNCLMPWFVRVEQALERDILSNSETLSFDFDDRELIRGDLNAQMNSYTKALGAGGSQAIMSLNEVRYEFGLDPVDADWAKVPSMGGYAKVAGMSSRKTETTKS